MHSTVSLRRAFSFAAALLLCALFSTDANAQQRRRTRPAVPHAPVADATEATAPRPPSPPTRQRSPLTLAWLLPPLLFGLALRLWLMTQNAGITMDSPLYWRMAQALSRALGL